MIPLSYWDLVAAAAAVVALALANRMAGLGVSRQLLWLAFRGSAQLLLLGLVLRFVLGTSHPVIVGLMALFMLAVAAREVKIRQARPLAGRWGYLAGATAMFLSSFLFHGLRARGGAGDGPVVGAPLLHPAARDCCSATP